MLTQAVDQALTAMDRCDSCGAQARVIVTFNNGELKFCGHHAKQKTASLIENSISIYDPDEFILF